MAKRRRELQIARIRKELLVEQAAQLVGVTASAWNKWEQGIRTPTITKAFKVAEVLEVPVETLFGDLVSHEVAR